MCNYAWVWIPASLAASSNSSFTQHSSKSPWYFQVMPSWDRHGRKNGGNLNETQAFSAAQSTVATTLKSSREQWQRESTRDLPITPFISTAARRGRSRRRDNQTPWHRLPRQTQSALSAPERFLLFSKVLNVGVLDWTVLRVSYCFTPVFLNLCLWASLHLSNL